MAVRQLLDPIGSLKALCQPSLHSNLDKQDQDDMVKVAAGMTRWCGCFFIVFSLANYYLTTLKYSQAKPLMRVMGICWILDSLVVKLVGFHLQAGKVFNKADAMGGGTYDLLTGLLLLTKSFE